MGLLVLLAKGVCFSLTDVQEMPDRAIPVSLLTQMDENKNTINISVSLY
jgi:hypothetical protein